MTECTFHPENHATAELNVHDATIDCQITLMICDDCVASYDEVRKQYAVSELESETQ